MRKVAQLSQLPLGQPKFKELEQGDELTYREVEVGGKVYFNKFDAVYAQSGERITSIYATVDVGGVRVTGVNSANKIHSFRIKLPPNKVGKNMTCLEMAEVLKGELQKKFVWRYVYESIS